MQKNYFNVTGDLTQIGEEQEIDRGTNILRKRLLTIVTSDKQKFFPELRNNKLYLLESENLEVGDTVKIEFSFEGSEKNGKRYNNIFIASITKL